MCMSTALFVCFALHLGMCLLEESPLVLSGWLCVSLGWRDSSSLLKHRGFVNDNHEYFGGRGIARCPFPHNFREYICDVAVYFGRGRIAHRPSSSQRRHVPRRKRERPSSSKSASSSEEEEQVLLLTMWVCTSEEGTGLLPRNVGEYMQLVLCCVLSMSPSRGVPALRMCLCWGTT